MFPKRFYVYRIIDGAMMYWNGKEWDSEWAEYYTEDNAKKLAASLGADYAEGQV